MKVTSEELCKALRCSATPIPKGADIIQYCKGCPYNKNGMSSCCDVDRMGMDAAARIEKLDARLDKAVELLKAKFLAADLCSVCKHGIESDFLDFCTDCCGDRFEWRE